MLSKINISNLENSISNSSIYSDACQNTIELEEHYQKMNTLKNMQEKIKISNKKEEQNNNDFNENNIVINAYKNNSSRHSMSEIYESFTEEKSQMDKISNINEENKSKNKKIKERNSINYLNNKVIGKNESIDILKYKNDNLKLIYDNQNDKIDLNNKTSINSINELINNKKINNLNLSNINIIINRGENYNSRKKQRNECNNNLSSIQEKNTKTDKNTVNNSSLSRHSVSNNLKSEKILYHKEDKSNNNNEKSINIYNNENEIDSNELKSLDSTKRGIKNNNSIKNESNNNIDNKEINKNLNIKELSNTNKNLKKNIINDNIDKNKNNNNKLNATNMETQKEKKSVDSLSNYLENIDSNELDNVTIIKKVKKKGKKNSNGTCPIYNSYNENSSFFSFSNSLLVNSIKFDGIGNNEIDLDFLKSLRTIPIKYKKKTQKKYLKTLLELQHFFIDDSSIRVLKISEDGQYLSAGMSSGKIKLFEIIGFDYNKFELSYDKKNAMNYLNFINEKPFKVLNRHTQDVIDLSWSSFFFNLLLSASLDNVILWDIYLSEEKCRIESFEHTNMVTCISFSPTEKYKFVSGCLDKFVRIWDFKDILDITPYNSSNNNINNDNESQDKNKNEQNSINLNKLKKYNILYFNIEEKITAISYFPSGDKIAIGTHNGRIIIYERKSNKYYYNSSFSCKNRIGKNSLGKKITSIEFFNKNDAVISSCDSRIRLMSMNDGKLIHKYKGYLNENSMIRSCIDYNYDIIISGSEDGFCYVWNIDGEEKKVLNYEYFKPYSQEIIHCSLIVPEKCYCNFLKKIMKITDKLLVTSIIINASNKGRLEILLNIDEKL